MKTTLMSVGAARFIDNTKMYIMTVERLSTPHYSAEYAISAEKAEKLADKLLKAGGRAAIRTMQNENGEFYIISNFISLWY